MNAYANCGPAKPLRGVRSVRRNGLRGVNNVPAPKVIRLHRRALNHATSAIMWLLLKLPVDKILRALPALQSAAEIRVAIAAAIEVVASRSENSARNLDR